MPAGEPECTLLDVTAHRSPALSLFPFSMKEGFGLLSDIDLGDQLLISDRLLLLSHSLTFSS
jgi:hypothetical protein